MERSIYSATSELAIGIDLGTTCSCVGVWKNERVEIIGNQRGNRTTPSWVAFTDKEIQVGEEAKRSLVENPENTVYDIKRIIGAKYDEDMFKKELKHATFKVERGENGNPRIPAKYKGNNEKYAPEEISCFILSKLKGIAEDFLKENVKKAVITVPAHFNDAQREATKKAAELAGLDVLKIFNEPTSAIFAYGLDKKNLKNQNVLVFDFGGGTVDVSLININDTVFEVKASKGKKHLGGEDFNNAMITECVEQFKKSTGLDIQNEKKALYRLRAQCERAKIDLSTRPSVTVSLESLFQGKNFSYEFTREKFNELCQPLFEKCTTLITEVLNEAEVPLPNVHEIVMVGGSSRIPRVVEMIKNLFEGKEPKQSINPDEAIAYGAAIQGAVITGHLKKYFLLDITPFNLGIETKGGIMSTIIKRNTPIPYKETKKNYTTVSDGQKQVNIVVYEGQRELVKDNRKLGNFLIKNIPNAKAGVPSIHVVFSVDENGILSVTAEEQSSKTQNSIKIENDKGSLTQEEIEQALKKAREFREEDIAKRERIQARNNYEALINQVLRLKKDSKAMEKLNPKEAKEVENLYNEHKKWLDSHETSSKKEIEAQMCKVEIRFCPLQEKAEAATQKKMPFLTKNASKESNLSRRDTVGSEIELD